MNAADATRVDTDETPPAAMTTLPETIDFRDVRIDPAWAAKVPPSLAMRRLALPVCVVGGELVVAMADPADAATAEAVARAAGRPVRPLRAEPGALRRALLGVYGEVRAAEAGPAAMGGADDAPAVVDAILRAAVLRRASDIHLDPMGDALRVRLRVDGLLEEFQRLPTSLQPAIVSRIKVLAGLDIAERRAPQDGAFVWRPAGLADRPPCDIRVATLPVRFGERITLRLLESGGDRLPLEGLGMAEEQLARFRGVLARPHGMLLLTGPTGSGKTTTLHAAIRTLLANGAPSILSVEDPIEYEIPEIAQAEVDSGDKVNFTKALRSLLRHDPDVIMIGEIRDAESLDIAVKASLTGHLVLSTLHTNDAVSTVSRLADMGLERHLIAATLRLSVAQRLVRGLCPRCREPYALSAAEASLLRNPALEGRTAYRPAGCLHCGGRGGIGRTGVFEFFEPDEEIASLIAAGAPDGQIAETLRQRGEPTLLDDAVRKVLSGATTVAELLRVV